MDRLLRLLRLRKEKEPEVYYKFMPQPDITARELSMVINLELTKEQHAKIDHRLIRHFKALVR